MADNEIRKANTVYAKTILVKPISIYHIYTASGVFLERYIVAYYFYTYTACWVAFYRIFPTNRNVSSS